MHESIKRFLKREKITYQEMADLSALTTFHTGGVCDLLITLGSEGEASAVLAELARQKLPYFVLGKGSNLLAPDGMTTRILLKWSEDYLTPRAEETIVHCGAGVPLTRLCRFAQQNSLTGLEFAYGIPGSVGGAVFMNAGAYGGEIKDCLLAVHGLDSSGRPFTMPADRAELGYRTSVFQHNGCLITDATFRLASGDPKQIESRMQDLMARRKEKQPLEYPSAGSTFRRPEGYYAGALIESVGLKGFTVGGAQVSEKHAGFCINKGGATTSDVLLLIEEIQKRVKIQTGVLLKTEVRMIPRS